MNGIPTRWATVDVDWGEGKKHIHSIDSASLDFHKSEEDARKSAEMEVRKGARMVAILEVKTMIVAKPVEFDQI